MPTLEALQELVRRVALRVTKLLVRKGLIVERPREEGGAISIGPEDPTAMDLAQGASIREFVGLETNGSGWR